MTIEKRFVAIVVRADTKSIARLKSCVGMNRITRKEYGGVVAWSVVVLCEVANDGEREKVGRKLYLALGLFILAGVFRQMERAAGTLWSAGWFLLTNLIYIGLGMAWGFSIARRILHRGERR